jgi:hypothetical protein
MGRQFLLFTFIGWASVSPSRAADGEQALIKSIEPGPLADFFTIVSATRKFSDNTGVEIILKLRAKKEVDTSKLYFNVGYFDKENHLHLTYIQMGFREQFVLKEGETVNLEVGYGREDRIWHRIVIQKGEKPRRQVIIRDFP